MNDFLQMYRAELLIKLAEAARGIGEKMGGGDIIWKRAYETANKSLELSYEILKKDSNQP
jgi:hypothetical protein